MIHRFLLALLVAGSTLLPPGVAAQDWPSRPLKIVVPFSPGGAVDGPSRLVANELAKRLGQPVIVENRPGAGATIGSEAVAKSPPDGYTLLLASQTNAISASLYSRLNYQPLDDFAPIGLIAREPGVIVVHPDFPAKTVGELIALAKKGDVLYASSGNGSGQHLFAAMFAKMAGIRMTHIPYKGSGQATTDVIGGIVPVSFPGLSGMLGFIRAGKLRALAVTGTKRSPSLPEVPTVSESGVPGFNAYVWMGLLAPKATPQPILERLQKELVAVLATPEVKHYMDQHSLEIIASTPADFAAFFREERDRWAVIVKDTGAKVD
jgi:tripartite-type tricarboxylate transporter receptor subunit TctC